MRTSVPGVATGLAWTPTGGDILFVEASRVPGNNKLILTGQLGDVMKESAQAALTLVKARAVELGIDPLLFAKSDVHIHVPAGAIPKDGPSAGVAMFVALVSLLTGRTARSDAAMTGEISLRGLVLPIGGVKEKVLAALQAGITTVLLPARNRKDLDEVPEDARKRVRFVWLEKVDDAVAAVLDIGAAAPRTASLPRRRRGPPGGAIGLATSTRNVSCKLDPGLRQGDDALFVDDYFEASKEARISRLMLAKSGSLDAACLTTSSASRSRAATATSGAAWGLPVATSSAQIRRTAVADA